MAKNKTTTKTKNMTRKTPARKKNMAIAVKRTPARFCYYVPASADRDERGRYRASIVFEDEPGHRPTGIWPNDGTKEMPYFWGDSLESALARAMAVNKNNLGLSERDVHEIVASSMHVDAQGVPRSRTTRAS